MIEPPSGQGDTSRPPSVRDILSGALRARAESLLARRQSAESQPATPARDTSAPPCGADSGGAAAYPGPLQLLGVKYDPARTMLFVSITVDTVPLRIAGSTLLINLSLRIVDRAGRASMVNRFNVPLDSAAVRFAPRDSTRAGVVLTLPWDGKDASGAPLSGPGRAGYKASLVRVLEGRRSFVGRGAFGTVPVAF